MCLIDVHGIALTRLAGVRQDLLSHEVKAVLPDFFHVDFDVVTRDGHLDAAWPPPNAS